VTARRPARRSGASAFLATAITAVVAAGLAACTVGGDNGFHEIKDVRVPTLPPTTTSTTVPQSTTTIAVPSTTLAPTTTIVLVEEKLYFIAGAKLKLVVRRVPTTASINTVLNDLGRGPLPGENLRTAVKPEYWGDTSIGTNGVASVELTLAFSSLTDSDAQLAIAQIVYTLTELGGVGQVAFLRDGQPLSVPKGDGAQTVKPVSKDDYPAFTPQ
jgi:spore germination protein GerM